MSQRKGTCATTAFNLGSSARRRARFRRPGWFRKSRPSGCRYPGEPSGNRRRESHPRTPTDNTRPGAVETPGEFVGCVNLPKFGRKSMRVEYRSLGGVGVRALLALPHPRVANHPAGCLQSSRFRATAALLYGSGSRRSASLASIGSAARRSRVSRQNEEISWAWTGCPARKSAIRIPKR